MLIGQCIDSFFGFTICCFTYHTSNSHEPKPQCFIASTPGLPTPTRATYRLHLSKRALPERISIVRLSLTVYLAVTVDMSTSGWSISLEAWGDVITVRDLSRSASVAVFVGVPNSHAVLNSLVEDGIEACAGSLEEMEEVFPRGVVGWGD